jgi:hypothetical protein
MPKVDLIILYFNVVKLGRELFKLLLKVELKFIITDTIFIKYLYYQFSFLKL